MQVANVAREAFEAALFRGAPPPGKLPPPHFFRAAWNLLALTPLGSLNPPPAGGWPEAPGVPPAGGCPPCCAGSVIPSFARHVRSAANRLAPGAPREAVELALEEDELLLEEPPQDASAVELRTAIAARLTAE
jgi:hypothetical protein